MHNNELMMMKPVKKIKGKRQSKLWETLSYLNANLPSHHAPIHTLDPGTIPTLFFLNIYAIEMYINSYCSFI